MRRPILLALLVLSLSTATPLTRFARAAAPTTAPSQHARASAFYPPTLLARVRANVERDEWGRKMRQLAVEQAAPWKAMGDDQLWALMFGATLPRSWMVWSNGHCPACQKPVPMYDWRIDALKRPWKLACPHCEELFPKNDFAKFHASGLDAHGVFDPARADRALLFNAEHPDPQDPLHRFGVDDGTGYVDAAGNRWRFIPAYLVYGQWKQAVQMGIKRLATAYVVTGDAEYGRKAAILLDRVADVYPAFDFKTQGILYESVRADGYVSVWHDATIETREMVQAYDAVKDVILNDASLAEFLARKSEQFQTPARKKTGGDVAANIEQRLLRDALANPHKIYSNFPQQHLTIAVIHTALGWPGNREDVLKMLDPVIAQSTSVDGTTGEKGLANYSSYAAQRLAEFLGYYTRIDEQFLPEMVKRHPRLPQMWRFFIDAWCADENYYPLTGDTGHFAARHDYYAGIAFLQDHALGATGHMSGVLAPSMYSFLRDLHRVTSDPAFVQVLHKATKDALDGLPYDLAQDDPAAFQREVKAVLDEHGPDLKLSSVNKQEWRLAVLRSGAGAKSRAAWLDYDAGGQHGHFDGLNLGLFARGLDLMPDFGYPPVQFGGWGSERAQWYVSTAAHNTVLVNGAQQTTAQGQTTLWASGDGFHAITAVAPGLYPGVTKRYERTVALIDTSDDDAYVLDVFRVAGGGDHAKFFLSHFGTATPSASLGTMAPADDFAHPQMRNWRVSRRAPPGWSAEWNVEDRYKLLPPGAGGVRVRYHDFTAGADAYLGEAWVVAGIYNSTEEAWVPRVMVRRKGDDVASTFVSLIEPFGATPLIKRASRVPLKDDHSAVLSVELTDGRNDVLVSNDAGAVLAVPEARLTADAKLALVRRDAKGRVAMIAVCQGRSLAIGEVELELADGADFVQLRLNDDGTATLLAGTPKSVRSLRVAGKAVTPG